MVSFFLVGGESQTIWKVLAGLISSSPRAHAPPTTNADIQPSMDANGASRAVVPTTLACAKSGETFIFQAHCRHHFLDIVSRAPTKLTYSVRLTGNQTK